MKTFNQEGLQWRPRVREVPLLAGLIHGGRRATCGETSESFLTPLFLAGITLADPKHSHPTEAADKNHPQLSTLSHVRGLVYQL